MSGASGWWRKATRGWWEVQALSVLLACPLSTRSYEDKYYFWESVIMARKFVLVVVVVFLTNVGVDMQLVVALGAIITAMIAHMLAEPFR